MAKKVENSKGFLVIEVSLKECVEKFGGIGICDLCNKASCDGYYIAVLNDCVCPDCYNSWLERATRYEEDIPFEQRNYDHYSKMLGLQNDLNAKEEKINKIKELEKRKEMCLYQKKITTSLSTSIEYDQEIDSINRALELLNCEINQK